MSLRERIINLMTDESGLVQFETIEEHIAAIKSALPNVNRVTFSNANNYALRPAITQFLIDTVSPAESLRDRLYTHDEVGLTNDEMTIVEFLAPHLLLSATEQTAISRRVRLAYLWRLKYIQENGLLITPTKAQTPDGTGEIEIRVVRNDAAERLPNINECGECYIAANIITT